MSYVTVRYWAGARAAAGQDTEALAATTVTDVVKQLTARDHNLGELLTRCSLLVNGQRVNDHHDLNNSDAHNHYLNDGDVVEVLPPFAGG
ncbi:MAG: MoaD/ThiS family protein [Actinomycetota bacterium]